MPRAYIVIIQILPRLRMKATHLNDVTESVSENCISALENHNLSNKSHGFTSKQSRTNNSTDAFHREKKKWLVISHLELITI